MNNETSNTEIAETAENGKTIRLRVLTPMRVAYDKQVSMFVARTVDGDMGVLFGHEPRSAVLADWALRIFPDAQNRGEELLMVLGGILTVKDNTAVIVSDMAEYPDKMRELIEKMKAEREESKLKKLAIVWLAPVFLHVFTACVGLPLAFRVGALGRQALGYGGDAHRQCQVDHKGDRRRQQIHFHRMITSTSVSKYIPP